jgi:nucleotide-binding universal stress UspA family protein
VGAQTASVTKAALPTQNSSTLAHQAQANTVQLVELGEDEAYLQQLKARLISPEAAFQLLDEKVETRVIHGKSPRELAAIIKELNGDLVVMTTHGRSGLSLLMAGSVATNLIQHTNVPVILIKPTDSAVINQPSGTDNIQPIVVTLDGSQDSEAILEAASSLALQLGVKLHLLQVVSVLVPDVSGQLTFPPDYDLEDEGLQLKKQAEEYLKGLQTGFQAKGIDCVTTVLVGEPIIGMIYNSEPVFKIAEYAETVNAQLLAMATHARGRFSQVLQGSMSEEEVRHNPLPVVLVRMPEHHQHPNEK